MQRKFLYLKYLGKNVHISLLQKGEKYHNKSIIDSSFIQGMFLPQNLTLKKGELLQNTMKGILVAQGDDRRKMDKWCTEDAAERLHHLVIIVQH